VKRFPERRGSIEIAVGLSAGLTDTTWKDGRVDCAAASDGNARVETATRAQAWLPPPTVPAAATGGEGNASAARPTAKASTNKYRLDLVRFI
jgi:hypothetical protein